MSAYRLPYLCAVCVVMTNLPSCVWSVLCLWWIMPLLFLLLFVSCKNFTHVECRKCWCCGEFWKVTNSAVMEQIVVSFSTPHLQMIKYFGACNLTTWIPSTLLCVPQVVIIMLWVVTRCKLCADGISYCLWWLILLLLFLGWDEASALQNYTWS